MNKNESFWSPHSTHYPSIHRLCTKGPSFASLSCPILNIRFFQRGSWPTSRRWAHTRSCSPTSAWPSRPGTSQTSTSHSWPGTNGINGRQWPPMEINGSSLRVQTGLLTGGCCWPPGPPTVSGSGPSSSRCIITSKLSDRLIAFPLGPVPVPPIYGNALLLSCRKLTFISIAKVEPLYG